MLANKARLIAHQFLLQHKTENFQSLIVNFNELSEQLEVLLNSNEVKTLHHKPFNPVYLDAFTSAQIRRSTPAEFLHAVYLDAITLGHYDVLYLSLDPDHMIQQITNLQAFYHGAHGEWEQHGHTAEYAHSQRHTLNLMHHYCAHLFYAVKLGIFN